MKIAHKLNNISSNHHVLNINDFEAIVPRSFSINVANPIDIEKTAIKINAELIEKRYLKYLSKIWFIRQQKYLFLLLLMLD